MDEIDRKILIQLDKNVRVSNTQIAKAVRASKDVVSYRIARLQEAGILTGFFALTASSKLNRHFYKLLLKFQSIGTEHEKELLGWLNKNEHVVWTGSSDGNWNLIITLSVENIKQLTDLLDSLYAKYGRYMSKKELLSVKSVAMYNEKYLYPKGQFAYEHYLDFTAKPEQIDKKDLILLKSVADNSRSSIVTLAKAINLTPEATAKRLKSLLKKGFIVGYKPRISFTKLGYEYFHVFISARTPSAVKEIIDYYKSHPDCVAILEELGYYDMHLEFVIKTTQQFRDILKDLRDRFGDKIHEYEPLQIYTEYRINPLPS